MNTASKLLGLLFAAAALVVPATAHASTFCPVRETSIFGTIRDADPNMVTLETNSRMGSIHVFTHGARVYANGLTIRPGVFAGIYGCLAPADRSFKASEITLATSAETYPRMHLTTGDTWISGRIDVVAPGRVQIDSGGGHGETWVQTSQQGLYVGQLIQAFGRFTSGDRTFVANKVAILRQ